MYDTLIRSPLTVGQFHFSLAQQFGPQRTLFRWFKTGALLRTPMPLSELSTPVKADFEIGSKVRFRVRLNPVASKSVAGERGKKYVVPTASRVEWATSMLAKAGLDAVVTSMGSGAEPIKQNTTHAMWADFEGTATVTDPEALANAINSGIGRQKAFGSGLLEVSAS